MNETKIEPCPFCGKKVGEIKIGDLRWIGCADCNKSSDGYKKDIPSITGYLRSFAIANWNNKVAKWRKEKESKNAAE